MKKLVSAVATIALSLGALVALEGPASATDNVGAYPLNINSASAPGDAKEFLTYDGKVYFVANSLDHGRAIYSTSATSPSGYTYFDSRSTSPKMGDPRKLFGFANAIYYWDSPTNNWSTYTLYGKNTTGSGHFEVETPSAASFVVPGDRIYNPVTLGGNMYFIAAESSTPEDLKFWKLDGSSSTISMVTDINFLPGMPFTESNQGYGYTQDALQVFDGKIYLSTANSNWNTSDSELKQYDPATDTWSTINDSGSPFLGSSLMGKYRYNNQDVLIFGKRASGFRYYYLTADGVIHRFGSFSTGYSGYFVNLGERLFFYNYPVFNEVSASTGEITDIISTLAPGAVNVHVESVVETNNKLVLMAKPSNTDNNSEYLYQWDGTNGMTKIGTIAPIVGLNGGWLPEYPTTTGWGRNTSMTAAGNGVILNLYLDAALGYEPYYVNLNGTATALGDINNVSDGSAPYMNCSSAGGNTDFVAARVTGLFGEKGVITEFKQDGIYLKYKVIEVPNVTDICGIVNDGTNTYFKGYDRSSDGNAVFKMDANHAVTKIGSMSYGTYQGFVYQGSYFYKNDDNSDIYVVNSAGVETRLTGANGSPISEGSIDQVKQIGSKLYISGETPNGDKNLFSIDMANPNTAPVSYLTNTDSGWKSRVRNLTVSGTKLYFTYVPASATDGSKVYSVDSANSNPAVEVFDVYTDPQTLDIVTDMRIIGDTFYMNAYDDNNSNSRWFLKRSGSATTGSVVALPNNFAPDCMAIIGGELLLTNGDGVAKYLGDGSSTFRDAGLVYSNNSSALCDAISSERGTYFSYPEQSRQGPWGSEPAYLGHLIPIAVERLGVSVTEAPATALSGTVQPAVPGPNTSVDTDDVTLGNLDETLDFSGSVGSINFPDGSGFIIDAKGNVKAKTKSIYLIQASGKIKFSYISGTKTKSVTCNIKTFGSKKKVKTAFTTKKIYTSGTVCKLSPTVIKAMKTGVVTVVQTLKVNRYYSTTMKAKTPAGAVIKAQNRKMTVRMGKLN